jgi:Ca2+-binding EF-hand superfamily protein
VVSKSVLLVSCLLAAPLYAQTVQPLPDDVAGQRLDRQFQQADRNGDGVLTRQEARQGAPDVLRKFDRLDANHDGAVSRQELENAYKTRAQREFERFRALDTDKDGYLSRDEFAREAPQGKGAFSALDANGDGKISQQEYQRMLQRNYWNDLDKSLVPGLVYQKSF